jgi:integrase
MALLLLAFASLPALRHRSPLVLTPYLIGGSDLDFGAAAELVAEAALQVHETAEAEQSLDVLLAAEGAEHAAEVVGGGDLGTEASAERLAPRAAAKVVVAARASWLGHELELTGARFQLDHGLFELERGRAPRLRDRRAPYGNLIRFACLTGLRQGELFALRDRALDLAPRTVAVKAGAREGKLVPTKTAAGGRQVRLSGEALRVLREHLLARAPNELGLVFPTPNGTVWRKDNFMARVFRPAVRRAQLQPLRFQDLRHTYAALMVAAGAFAPPQHVLPPASFVRQA